jgi:hypothetical protein
LHRVELVADIAAQACGWPGHFFEGEELARVDCTLPDKLIVDVGEKAFTNLDARAGEDKRLERDVRHVDLFLKGGGGFDFHQVPGIAVGWHEQVCAGVTAVEGEGGFV